MESTDNFVYNHNFVYNVYFPRHKEIIFARFNLCKINVLLNSLLDFLCILQDIMCILRSVAEEEIESKVQQIDEKVALNFLSEDILEKTGNNMNSY